MFRLALVYVGRGGQIFVGPFVVVQSLDGVLVLGQFGFATNQRFVRVTSLFSLKITIKSLY